MRYPTLLCLKSDHLNFCLPKLHNSDFLHSVPIQDILVTNQCEEQKYCRKMNKIKNDLISFHFIRHPNKIRVNSKMH
jgi:hypothetical protein